MALGALLLAEYLLISLLFDARALRAHAGALSVLRYVGDVGSFGLVAAAATLGLMGPALRRAAASLPTPKDGGVSGWGVLAVHLLAYGAFLLVTRRVFSVHPNHPPQLGWAIGWLLGGAAVGASWLLMAVPWRAVRPLWRGLSAALLVGVATGGAAWISGSASSAMWGAMAPLTLSAVRSLLSLLVHAVVVDPAALVIGTDGFVVQVAPECSGFEGIGLILALLGGYFIIERKSLRFPRVLVLLPISVLAVWIANIVRIVMLILIGSYLSPAVAIGGFHSKAGWLLFCGIALGFVAIIRTSATFSRDLPPREGTGPNPTAAHLMPLLTLLAAGLVTGLVTVGFDFLYPVRAALTLLVIFAFRAQYRAWQWRPEWHSVAVGVGVFILWYALAAGGDAAATRELREGLARLGPAAAALWMLARVVGAGIAIPIAEELAFRGYLLRRLVNADFTQTDPRAAGWLPAITSSLAFGALHHDWLAATAAGLGFALAQRHRGEVADAIVAHAVTNLLLCADVLLLGHLRWWA